MCLLFLGISWLWGDDPLPLAFQKARAAPLIHKVNRILISLAPQHLGGLSQVQSDPFPPPALETDKTQQSYELLAQPKPKAQKKNKEVAYTPQDRQNLDLLMEKINNLMAIPFFKNFRRGQIFYIGNSMGNLPAIF